MPHECNRDCPSLHRGRTFEAELLDGLTRRGNEGIHGDAHGVNIIGGL